MRPPEAHKSSDSCSDSRLSTCPSLCHICEAPSASHVHSVLKSNTANSSLSSLVPTDVGHCSNCGCTPAHTTLATLLQFRSYQCSGGPSALPVRSCVHRRWWWWRMWCLVRGWMCVGVKRGNLLFCKKCICSKKETDIFHQEKSILKMFTMVSGIRYPYDNSLEERIFDAWNTRDKRKPIFSEAQCMLHSLYLDSLFQTNINDHPHVVLHHQSKQRHAMCASGRCCCVHSQWRRHTALRKRFFSDAPSTFSPSSLLLSPITCATIELEVTCLLLYVQLWRFAHLRWWWRRIPIHIVRISPSVVPDSHPPFFLLQDWKSQSVRVVRFFSASHHLVYSHLSFIVLTLSLTVASWFLQTFVQNLWNLSSVFLVNSWSFQYGGEPGEGSSFLRKVAADPCSDHAVMFCWCA